MIILIVALVSAFDMPAGALPKLHQKYKNHINEGTGEFTCFDKKKIIGIEKINDGFVDCADGSDEPGTSAFLGGGFYCRNEGSVPLVIEKWSVGDGVCDCCDGSDEMFNPHANCTNTCDKYEAERLKLYNFVKLEMRKGIEIRRERAKKSVGILEKANKEVESIQSQLDDLERRRKDLEKMREGDGNLSDIVQEIEVSPTTDREQRKKELEATIDRLSELDLKDDGLSDELNDELGEAIRELSELNNEEFRNTVKSKGNGGPGRSGASNGGKRATSTSGSGDADDSHNDSYWMFLFRAAWRMTFHVPPKRYSIFQANKERGLKQLDDKITKVKKSLKDAEKAVDEMGTKFDPSGAAINGQKFEYNGFEFTYIKNVYSDGINLGSYRSFVNRTLLFENGRYCWEAKRGTKTELEQICWSKDILLNVRESSTCMYKGVFATPTVCTEEDVDELKDFSYEKLSSIVELINSNQ